MIFRIVRDGLWEMANAVPAIAECSVFRLMTPPLSRVGLTEEQARAKRRNGASGDITGERRSLAPVL